MQADPGRELFRMFVERIVKRAFAKESTAARLQQIGLFALIYMMERDAEPLTAARLAQFTGLAESQVSTHLNKLLRRDMVVRTKITSKHGKGRSYRLSIKHTAETKKLVEALDMFGQKKASAGGGSGAAVARIERQRNPGPFYPAADFVSTFAALKPRYAYRHTSLTACLPTDGRLARSWPPA